MISPSIERIGGDVDDHVAVYFIDLDRDEAELQRIEKSQPRLSVGDLARAAGLKHDDARKRWVSARIATRLAIERHAGPQFRQVEFRIAPGGRPALGGGAPHFSIAHTAAVALIGISAQAPLGVDIEASDRPVKMSAERRRRIVEAAKRMSPKRNFGDPADNASFLQAWVCLEAIGKCRGTGVGRVLTELGVVGGQSGPVEASESGASDVQVLQVPAGFIAAIAGPPETRAVAVLDLLSGQPLQ